jgi:hypothetical protein
MDNQEQQQTGFKELLSNMMQRRWYITAIVLFTFLFLTLGMVLSIHTETIVGQEWKELLLLMLGAFIGSYGKIIDYWFSDTDKDKMLVQKMDEEDGVSLSNTLGGDIPEPPKPSINKIEVVEPEIVKEQPKVGVEIDEDGDGIMDGIDFDGDGIIDEYFVHRSCEHVWGDLDGDGTEECLKCGKIKDPNPDDHMDG